MVLDKAYVSSFIEKLKKLTMCPIGNLESSSR